MNSIRNLAGVLAFIWAFIGVIEGLTSVRSPVPTILSDVGAGLIFAILFLGLSIPQNQKKE